MESSEQFLAPELAKTNVLTSQLGVLASLGQRADEVFRVEGDSPLPGLFAFVPSGWLNMNLTAVLVRRARSRPG